MSLCEAATAVNKSNSSSPTHRVYTKSKASPICRWWVRGKCLYGNKCKLLHPEHLFASKTSQQQREQYLQQNNERNKAIKHGSKKHWGKKKRTKKESIFRQWLLDNFGHDLLSSSNVGILDIAGGKGILSFEFINLNGIKCTVCDPRNDLTLDRWLRSMRAGYLHRNQLIVEKYVDCSLEECQRRTDEQARPEHLRLFFDEKLIEFMDKQQGMDMDVNVDVDGQEFQDLIEYQLKQFKKFNPEEIVDADVNAIKQSIGRNCVRMIEMMKRCSVVIGMHPDYATEFIVDFALKYNKAFAVLPCCVFPKSFPRRRLNGKPVVKYADFCEYLSRKHPDIRQSDLILLPGQNKVIYRIPSAMQSNYSYSGNTVHTDSSFCQLI